MVQIAIILGKLKYLILSIVAATTVYPLLFIFLLPLSLFRYVVKKFVQRDPQMGEILSGLDSILGGDNPYTNPMCIIGAYYPFKQKIDRNQVVKVITEQVIKPNHFPNLQQLIVRRFGYHFWHKVDNFSVENHVRYYNSDDPDKPVTREELFSSEIENLKNKTFDSSTSPWECVLIPNFVENNDPSVKSLAMLRVNHCLMDGYSILKFAAKLSLRPWIVPGEIVADKPDKKNFWMKIRRLCQAALLVLTGPYHGVQLFILAKENNEIFNKIVSMSQECKELKYVTKMEEPERISMDRLKAVKNFHGVSMSALLVALNAMAVGKMLKARFGSIPEKMHMAMPCSMPGHPNAMTNHWSLLRIPVRVYENDPIRTLKDVMTEYRKIIQSPAPLVTFYVFRMIGALPISWLPKTSASGDVPKQTFFLTNFPGPGSKVADVFGYDYDDFSWIGLRQSGRTPFIFSSTSMGGTIRLGAAGLTTILRSQQEADDLTDSLVEFLMQMEKTASHIVHINEN